MRKFLLTTALAVAVSTAASGCSLFDRADPPSTPRGNNNNVPQPTTGGGGTPKPATTSQRPDGSVTARIKGSDRISCGSINSEITVTAQGRSQWTAEAKRTHVQADRGIANGVTLSPSSGELDSGESATIRVQGSYDGVSKVFYVFVMTPNRSGSGGSVLEFTCR
ncbi:hypothetical protein [Actinocrispum sp. NPDC049592]|uniref:hypothetical protein n=1 Tax=Actinocrispum sp. NPDC049592 TaxID=3154835 RepID=UPI00341531C9